MSLRTASIYLLLFLNSQLIRCQGGYTDIEQYPGYNLLPVCAQCSLSCSSISALQAGLGCKNWTCVCQNFDVAMSSASMWVMIECSRTQDVTSATSILNGFCFQLSTVTPITAPIAPTAVGDPGSGKVTVTPTDGTPVFTTVTSVANVASATDSSSTDSNGSSGGISKDAIIGIATSVPLGVIGIAVAIWAALRQKRQGDQNPNLIPSQAPNPYYPVAINPDHGYGYYR